MIDEKTYKKLKKRIHYSARKLGVKECELEDVSSWVFLKWAEKNERSGKYKGQTIDQGVIDYLRSNYGRKGSGSYDERRKFNEAYEYDETRDVRTNEQGTGFDSDYGRNFGKILRCIYFLYFKWGFSAQEISDCFGSSKGWVHLQIKKIQVRIYEDIKKEERDLQGETKETMEKILSKEKEINKWGVEQHKAEEMEGQKPVKTKSFAASSF